eukprot:gb/GFBE01039392.1/.p1 GENE.gb/GFBE01039392.1/~~gb/GFBE01039392.1/.p1  ORF type:complete len:386 (+),score=63.81 gb/GFBE01039392.1/:1-1158(+)
MPPAIRARPLLVAVSLWQHISALTEPSHCQEGGGVQLLQQRLELSEQTSRARLVEDVELEFDKFGLKLQEEPRPIPPIAFMKMQKAGSSTINNIFHRMGERRGMSFFLPWDNANLGYPGAFPGEPDGQISGGPDNQFDMIIDHAIFSEPMYRAYMKPMPFFTTILREPLSQQISVFNYFYKFKRLGWEGFLQSLETGSVPHECRNQQAQVLGWYQAVHNTMAYDNNTAAVDGFIRTLAPAFEDAGLVMLLEYFDESMVMLSKRLRVDLRELATPALNENTGEKIYPTDEQTLRLQQANAVDLQLYKYYNSSFWRMWGADNGVNSLSADLQQMTILNERLEAKCLTDFQGQKSVVNDGCPERMVMPHISYAMMLKKSQNWTGSHTQ